MTTREFCEQARRTRIANAVGRKFNRWTVLSQAEPRRGKTFVNVVCECGNQKTVLLSYIENGASTSCGCFRNEYLKARWTRHGYSKHPLWSRWRNMIARCHNPKNPSYKNYGARGIVVCNEWRHSPAAFYRWATEAGWSPAFQIDRIDNDGPYSPENCRFVTQALNNRNRRSSKLSDSDIAQIKAARASGSKMQVIAQRYGITTGMVGHIVFGRAWEAK